ncbi:hypothetical protein PC128_g6744 [Phytophthora cactorum]|nr:hypothetical protein PC128_g6744 [Phytophthora cactorum]
MKTLLIMAVVLPAVLHLLLLPIEWISTTFLIFETADATMRAFLYAAATTIPFLLAVSVALVGSKTPSSRDTELVRKVQ